MVSASYKLVEDNCKFYLRKTESLFNLVEYKDVVFFSHKVNEEKINSYNQGLTNATFTAWQILRHEGKTKKNWDKYLKIMVPSLKKNDKVSKNERMKILSEALETDRYLKAYEKFIKAKG